MPCPDLFLILGLKMMTFGAIWVLFLQFSCLSFTPYKANPILFLANTFRLGWDLGWDGPTVGEASKGAMGRDPSLPLDPLLPFPTRAGHKNGDRLQYT